MDNEEYQVLIRRPGAELRERLLEGAAPARRDALARDRRATSPTTTCRRSSPTSAGTTWTSSSGRFRAADAERDRPTVDLRLHDQGLAAAVRRRQPQPLGACCVPTRSSSSGATSGSTRTTPWAGFAAGLARGPAVPARRRTELGYDSAARRRSRRRTAPVIADAGRPDRGRRRAPSRRSATRWPALARDPEIGGRIVTASPDVAVSTNLGGWINRVGVFSPRRPARTRRRRQAAAGLGAGSGRPAHRARHQRDEPVHVAQPVRADRRAVRRAAGADRHGLRPVHRRGLDALDLRPLRQVAVRPRRRRRRASRWRPRAAPTSRP